MKYEDLLTIQTPEGVPIDLLLAGYGSRFIAAFIDGLLKLIVIGAAALVALAVGSQLALAVLAVIAFAITVGYDILFEVLAGGRTPAKRWSGLRVVQTDGRPVTLSVSAVRNLIRILDGPATGYSLGTIAVLATRRNQRIGDLAAGTVVVRERVTTPSSTAPAPGAATGHDSEREQTHGAWDVTGVTTEELIAVRTFLARRDELEGKARNRLALQLAGGLRERVPGAAPTLPAERFLEQLVGTRDRGT